MASLASKTLMTKGIQSLKEYCSALGIRNDLAAVVKCTLNAHVLVSLLGKTLFSM